MMKGALPRLNLQQDGSFTVHVDGQDVVVKHLLVKTETGWREARAVMIATEDGWKRP